MNALAIIALFRLIVNDLRETILNHKLYDKIRKGRQSVIFYTIKYVSKVVNKIK